MITQTIYIADVNNSALRKMTVGGNISTLTLTSSDSFWNPAQFFPVALVQDPISINIFIVDSEGYIWKLDPTTLVVTRIAGNNTGVFAGNGVALSAKFSPNGWAACDAAGNIYFSQGSYVYAVNLQATPQTLLNVPINSGHFAVVAGTFSSVGFSGDGGQATSALMAANVAGLAFDNNGTLYIVDANNQRIRSVFSNGVISTICGNGTESYTGDGGVASLATVATPAGLTFFSGGLFICDYMSARVRVINLSGGSKNFFGVTVANGSIDTVIGGGSVDNPPPGTGILVPADYKGDGSVCRVSAAPLTGTADISGSSVTWVSGAQFSQVQPGNPFFYPGAPGSGGAEWQVDHVVSPTSLVLAFHGSSGLSINIWIPLTSCIGWPSNVKFGSLSGNAFLGFDGRIIDSSPPLDLSDNSVRMIDANTAIISTVAGAYPGLAGYTGDGGLATLATFNSPLDILIVESTPPLPPNFPAPPGGDHFTKNAPLVSGPVQNVPLDNAPNQTWNVTVQVDGQPVTVTVVLRYNEIAKYWVATIFDSKRRLLLDSVPFVTGNGISQNLLSQFAYLGIGSATVFNASASA